MRSDVIRCNTYASEKCNQKVSCSVVIVGQAYGGLPSDKEHAMFRTRLFAIGLVVPFMAVASESEAEHAEAADIELEPRIPSQTSA